MDSRTDLKTQDTSAPKATGCCGGKADAQPKTKPNRVLQTPQNASLSNLAAVAARTEAMPCRVHTFYQLRPS